MKRNIIIASSLLLMSLASCSKLIEIKDTDAIVGDVALSTVANNEQAIIGAYAGMNVEQGILLNSTFADETRVGEFYNAQTTHEWQYGSTDIGLRDSYQSIYAQYTVIDRVNRVLAALPTASSSIATAATDPALKLRLKGEALFLRAFAHFEMYRFYCNSAVGTDLAMPYMTAPSLAPQARLTVTDYFTKMKADLVEAKSLLPDNLTDISRATKLAVSGLQARMSLYIQDWANASTFATEYINGVPLSTRANFPGIWSDANKGEQAFQLIRTATVGGRIGSLWRGTSTGSATAPVIGGITWRPSDKMWAAFDQVNDIRFSSYLKDEPVFLATRPFTRLIAKYAGTGYTTSAENVNNAKVFRTGEMYLIRAEAKAETGDLPGAAADLNALRAARINGYVNVALATKDAAITAIMDERFKELAYEGHRFFDLKRKNLPVSRLTTDAPTAGATTLPAGNFRFLLPIPNLEIQTNSLMVQNPGYTN